MAFLYYYQRAPSIDTKHLVHVYKKSRILSYSFPRRSDVNPRTLRQGNLASDFCSPGVLRLSRCGVERGLLLLNQHVAVHDFSSGHLAAIPDQPVANKQTCRAHTLQQSRDKPPTWFTNVLARCTIERLTILLNNNACCLYCMDICVSRCVPL